jgi:hypothetical protein
VAKQPRLRAAKGNRAAPIVILLLAGAAMAVLLFSAAILLLWIFVFRADRPPEPVAEAFEPAPALIEPAPPPQKSGPWWEGLPESSLAENATLLQVELPEEQAVLKRVGDRADVVRAAGYSDLLAKLPAMIRRPQPRRLLARFVSECYALEAAEANVRTLQLWLVKELPEENAEFAPGLKSEDLERSFWALEVCLSALTNKAIAPERRNHLAESLGTAFGLAIDTHVAAEAIKTDVEQRLARRCYRKLAPTASASLERALALRDALLRTVPQYLPPTFRAKRDVELAMHGLPHASQSWPAYSTLLRDCLKSDEAAIQLTVVEIYAQADPALATRLEPVLASRWSVAENAKLDRPAKVRAIHKAMGVPDPAERVELLAKVAQEARKIAADPANKRNATLQETARLAHASTLACALWQKKAGLAKFDELMGKVPAIDQGVAKAIKDDEPNAAPAPAGGPVLAAGGRPILLRGTLVPGVPRNTHPVALKRGATYAMHMVSGFDNFLYLYSSTGKLLAQDDDSGGGHNALIRFTAPVDDVYRVVASSFGGRLAGPYTITIQEAPPGFIPGPKGFLGPPLMPGPNIPAQPTPPAGGDTQTLIEQGDLSALLDTNPAANRIAAIQRIVIKLPPNLTQNDLAMRPAQLMARYLATIKTDAELEEVLPKIAPLAKSPNLLLALADRMDQDAVHQASQAVVGALVGQPLRFGKDDNWRLSCRRLLLRQTLALSSTSDPATEAAAIMRGLYAEQAILLGSDGAGLKELTRPSQVLEKMIEQLASNASSVGKEALTRADHEYLEQLPAQLQIARFLAQNDLEHTALLQRVWIRILPMVLALQNPGQAVAMRQVPQELFKADRLSRNVLDQLRGGEEKILRVWALAHELHRVAGTESAKSR